ncbi:MAG: RIP metalloprotease RseP [Gammaproteobacteria bacterium]|nr:MAG: RIP metalloprotease RseP [Gammaproteobacteria bacterium]
MEMLHTLLALVVTLGILVTFHEYGHFWVARKTGVRVLRFSVGFGTPLWTWYGKDGTEYVIAAIPLGGYVKMLDEREAPVPEDQLDQAFNRKPVGVRIAIAAAGPLANFLLAWVVYWAIAIMGQTKVVPLVGSVVPGSPAAESGVPVQTIIERINGHPVQDWYDINLRLIENLGESTSLTLTVVPREGGEARDIDVSVQDWLRGEVRPDPVGALGLVPYRPPIPPVIEAVIPGGAAEQGGLQAGDKVLAINGEPVSDWRELVKTVRASAGVPLEFEVERGGARLTLRVIPAHAESGGHGVIGAQSSSVSWPEDLVREVRYGPIEAVAEAWRDMVHMTVLTLDSMKKMVVGMISVENIGGPITIAKVAGASASLGLDSFLTFLAQLSITLAVLNLLPIPVLDGGHILFYSIEAIRGKPLSEEAQMLGIRIGMALIGMLMFLAIYNDIARL